MINRKLPLVFRGSGSNADDRVKLEQTEKEYTHTCPYPCHSAVLPPRTVEAFESYLTPVTLAQILHFIRE